LRGGAQDGASAQENPERGSERERLAADGEKRREKPVDPRPPRTNGPEVQSMTKRTNGTWGAVATGVALVASCGQTAAPEAAPAGGTVEAQAIIGGEPEAPADFLERPIRGTKRVLFYLLAYPPEPVFRTHVRNKDGLIPIDDYLVEVETKLEHNSMRKADGTFRLDVEPVLARVSMPSPIEHYDTGSTSNMVRVIQDARAEALLQAPPEADWDWQNYDYEVVLTEQFWSGPQGPGGFNRNFRISYCNVDYVNVVGLTLHEMGHGFKFEHADFWNAPPLEYTPGNSLVPYGDFFDAMGGSGNPQKADERHYNPRHKLWAGWLDPARVPIVNETGSFTIGRIENTYPNGLRGLRIRIDPEWTYYVFYRGNDPKADAHCNALACNGAIVTRSRETNLRPAGDTQLLHPLWSSSSTWETALLRETESFYDPAVGVEIHVTEVRPNAIDVDVNFNSSPQPAIDRLPVIDILQPAPGEILSGIQTIDVTAYDPDVGVAYWSGIDRIVIAVPYGYQGGNCSVPGTEYVHCTTLTGPGQPWVVDTSLFCDGSNEFIVEAHSTSPPAVRAIRFRFLTDNGNECPLPPE
jgi:hypothetical protein